jgi:prophage regulatory protein
MKLIRLNEVKAKTGLSRSSIYALISKGIFPQQALLCPGGRSVGWLCSEVEDYLAQRLAAR